MSNENNITRTTAQSLGAGNDHEGFVGRYKITSLGVEDLHEDRWCEGTIYTIHPFSSTSEEFYTKCLNILIRQGPADIFGKMSDIARKAYYVPMVKAGRHLICLHSQMSDLSYNFLKMGTCSKEVEKTFGPEEPFLPRSLKTGQTAFLSIWLSLADVGYVADSVGEKYDVSSRPEVVFIPVHYLEFTYDGKYYSMMSYGDREMTGMTGKDLPADDLLTSKELIWRRPWMCITLMVTFLIAVLAAVFLTACKVWFYFDSLFTRAVGAAIPIMLIYMVAWYLLRGIGFVLCFTMLPLERFLAKQWQYLAIWKNFRQKRKELGMRMHGYPVTFPDVRTYEVDSEPLDESFDDMHDRISAMGAVELFKRLFN